MRLAFTVAFLFALAACGYVGEPLPPASNFPATIKDLTARQTGDRSEIRFTLPGQTLEGLPITKPGEIELRFGPHPGPPFVTERWLASTRVTPLSWAAGLAVVQSLPAADWAGQELVIGVRAANPKGRFGGFSNLVAVNVAEPLIRPSGLSFAELPGGVKLSWMAPARQGVRYRVFKKEQGQKDPAPLLVATVDANDYLDPAIAYGRVYEYSVQSFLGDVVESNISAVATITPKDTFPPAAPTGITAIVGAQSVEVSWDRSSDADFALYRVYRSIDEGEFARLAETGANPSYSDRGRQPGKRHRYAITAVDERGNESARSELAEALP